MGRYQVDWPCCDSTSITEGYEPETCPFCTPSAPAAVQRQPLMEAEVLKVLESITNEPPQRLPPGWLRFARAIERAHGIVD